ncbi:hypothetical protein [Acinetobacter puyangensis]|uniref:hypothetical protein n=1 Tax=Acinetobacter puyangensis TaxID=1096779 RepID=UPI003A4DD7DB
MTYEELRRLEKKIEKVHNKITPTGRLSKVRSNHLAEFIVSAIYGGLEEHKEAMGERTYKKYINDLKKCGITEKFINKEYEREKSMREFERNHPELIQILLNMDLTQQVPEGYEPPKSQYSMKDILGKEEQPNNDQNIIKFIRK